MQITGSYQGYTKQQNLAALQNFVKQQQNTASTPNSQGGQSKKDYVEISQQGQQALQQALRAGSLNNLSGLTQSERDALRDARQRELRQNIDENLHFDSELTPAQLKEKQLIRNIMDKNLNFDDEFKNFIEYALNKSGIDFQDMEGIEIGLTGRGREIKMTVSGLKNESDNKKLAEELNAIISTTSPLTGSNKGGIAMLPIEHAFFYNSDYAMSADDEQERNNRAYLIREKDLADRFTKENGIDLDFSQLYRTEDGKIAGYPEETAWYFEADLNIPNIHNYGASTIRRYANELLDAGYDNIPNANELNVVFKFNQGSFVSSNASV